LPRVTELQRLRALECPMLRVTQTTIGRRAKSTYRHSDIYTEDRSSPESGGEGGRATRARRIRFAKSNSTTHVRGTRHPATGGGHRRQHTETPHGG